MEESTFKSDGVCEGLVSVDGVKVPGVKRGRKTQSVFSAIVADGELVV